MNKKRVLIIGAGVAGRMVANEIVKQNAIRDKYEIAGFLDDNSAISEIDGLKILGKIKDVRRVVEEFKVSEAIISIPSGRRELIESIVSLLTECGVPMRIVPGIFDIISGNVTWGQIREVRVEDLLGREEVDFEIEKISGVYKDKTVFVTGAGGSIGREIINNLLKLPVKCVYALGHGENSIHNAIEDFRKDGRFRYIIGDIRDFEKIQKEISGVKPDILFHAAAHKHVPLMEEFPDEAIKNNVIGTYNVAMAAKGAGVKNFVLISTDKAVNPTSVMGASKRIAEKIILSLNKYGGTRFSLVRFGNVLGSRGSVIPVFKRQIEAGGPVCVTHKDIERYFMSIPEAARLVIKCVGLSNGHIFVLDMGKPVKIIDLARNMIKLSGFKEGEISIEITGLRKGEKLYEELFRGNNPVESEFDKVLISDEEEDFYTSDEITGIIADFNGVISSYDGDKIKTLIKRYVPEYKFPVL